MMAHDSYHLLISLSFDGLLTDDQQDQLHQHMQTCALCTDTWVRMNALDRMLSVQPELAPPPDFTARVMSRVAAYQTRRQWSPWLAVILVVFSLLDGLSLAGPTLFFSLGLYRVMATWPVVGNVLVVASRAFGELVRAATFATDALIDWLTFLTREPAALAVVIAALVCASTYIGLREGLKGTSEAYQQQRA